MCLDTDKIGSHYRDIAYKILLLEGDKLISVRNEKDNSTNKFQDCLHSFITSKWFELERRGWNQIVEGKKLFPNLMYFLKIDSPGVDL